MILALFHATRIFASATIVVLVFFSEIAGDTCRPADAAHGGGKRLSDGTTHSRPREHKGAFWISSGLASPCSLTRPLSSATAQRTAARARTAHAFWIC
jgi:hypothetical protein